MLKLRSEPTSTVYDAHEPRISPAATTETCHWPFPGRLRVALRVTDSSNGAFLMVNDDHAIVSPTKKEGVGWKKDRIRRCPEDQHQRRDGHEAERERTLRWVRRYTRSLARANQPYLPYLFNPMIPTCTRTETDTVWRKLATKTFFVHWYRKNTVK